MADEQDTAAGGEAAEQGREKVVFYWRPGCPFCSALARGLDARGFAQEAIEAHNIWEEPEAAAFVRSVANGNETVPTIVVGPMAMVNPSPVEVLAAVGEHLPHLLPAGA